jgi:hypothetical protein
MVDFCCLIVVASVEGGDHRRHARLQGRAELSRPELHVIRRLRIVTRLGSFSDFVEFFRVEGETSLPTSVGM